MQRRDAIRLGAVAVGVWARGGAAETSPSLPAAKPGPGGLRYRELRRWAVPGARQGVAVDADYFYAIDNFALAKHRKFTGERVATWTGGSGGPWVHLNAGVVHDGRLYCAHSNFPGVPMESSVEIFDTATLRPAGSHPLGRTDGSLTWIDRRDGKWITCFVHYGRRGGEPGRGPERTYLAEYDDAWRSKRRWTLPAALMATVGAKGYSLSGGAFGPGGLLFVTGHDEPEMYVLRFPATGTTLEWQATLPVTAEGQAFGWDPVEPGVVHTILRKTREVIVGRVTPP